MLQFIQDNVVGIVPGGVMISHGALFILAVWFITSQLRKRLPGKRG
tara:strand:+ start:8218 stop:8355 length:138 start_codon:yes stop_codon:yes gene_type:complete